MEYQHVQNAPKNTNKKYQPGGVAVLMLSKTAIELQKQEKTRHDKDGGAGQSYEGNRTHTYIYMQCLLIMQDIWTIDILPTTTEISTSKYTQPTQRSVG